MQDVIKDSENAKGIWPRDYRCFTQIYGMDYIRRRGWWYQINLIKHLICISYAILSPLGVSDYLMFKIPESLIAINTPILYLMKKRHR